MSNKKGKKRVQASGKKRSIQENSANNLIKELKNNNSNNASKENNISVAVKEKIKDNTNIAVKNNSKVETGVKKSKPNKGVVIKAEGETRNKKEKSFNENMEGNKKTIEKDNKSNQEITPKKTTNQILNNNEENNIQENTEENLKKIKGKTGKILGISITILILAIVGIWTYIFGNTNTNSEIIVNGVSINGIDISGLTKQEATKKLEEIATTILSKELKLKYNETETVIMLNQIDGNFNIEETVNEAYKIGRSENILLNCYQNIKSKISETNLKMNFTFNEEKENEKIKEFNMQLTDAVQESSYYIDGTSLVITKGKTGYAVDKVNLVNYLNNTLENFNQNIETINVQIKIQEPENIDIEKIYSEVHATAQNAYISKEPFEIHKEVQGVDFAISIEEAKQIISEEKEEYTIPLTITQAEIRIEDLGEEAFPDLLATYTTTFNASQYNRTSNIALAAKKINGYVLSPGETFSYNEVVGKRTAAAGFKEAGAYLNGESVSEYGGGICQVSSTLYNATLYANLEIIARSNHTYVSSYVPVGRDATVSWGGPEFKFKNNRNYPVKIVAEVSGNSITVKLYGVKQDDDYEVEIQSYRVSTISPAVQYNQDANLAAGTQVVSQSGSSGCISETYKILKKNGEVISKTLISRDIYKAKPRIIRVGTKVEVAIPETDSAATVTVE